MTSDPQGDILAWLSRPATFGEGCEAVERIDTHISSIFLAGDRAYKLKRAVCLPFLDFTTLQQRQRACERELVVNRRTAPSLYLGLTAITRQGDGTLAFDGSGKIVDWLVVMVRFDQDLLFDRMAARGLLTRRSALDLADAVASFHRSAEPRPASGGEAGVHFIIDSNARTLQRFSPRLLDPSLVETVIKGAWDWLDRVGRRLERRRADGLVRQCHGDLHLGNICLFEGRTTLFDGIEFNDDFACIDVFYDLAFLIMDLDARGLPDLASTVFNRYLERTADFDAIATLPLFLSLRATIRAHVAAATFDKTGEAGLLESAKNYLAKAAGYLAPAAPRLVAVGGLSGTGKSSLAAALAPRLGGVPGAVVLRSDVLRKQLMGVALEQKLPPEAYAPEVTGRVFAALFARASEILAEGQAVIADAVFAKPEQRAALEAIAAHCGVPFSGLWLEAPPKILKTRVDRRRNDASDATVAVVERQLGYRLGRIDWTRLDAAGGAASVLSSACRLLRL